MGHLGDQVVAILTAIICVAIIAVILSKRSNTANVISSASAGLAEALGVAVSPITGTGYNFTTIGPNTGFAGNDFSF